MIIHRENSSEIYIVKEINQNAVKKRERDVKCKREHSMEYIGENDLDTFDQSLREESYMLTKGGTLSRRKIFLDGCSEM